MRTPIVLAAACLLAAGCSTSSTPTTASTPPADGGSFSSTSDLLAALKSASVPCTSASAVANPTAKGATSLEECAGSDSGDTSVAVFDTHTNALAFANSMASLAPQIGYDTYEVVGVNWVVNTKPAYGTRVHASMGGTVVAMSASASPN